MKKLFKSHLGIFSLLIVALAAALGADSGFAMAVTVVTGTTEKDPDDQNLNTQMPGVGANTTEAVESGFSQEEIDEAIALFRPFKTPLEYSIVMEAVQRPVSKYEVTHYRSGTSLFDVTTVANITSSSDGTAQVFTIKYTASSYASGTAALSTKADLKLLTECKVIHVPTGGTYTNASSGTSKTGPISLYVLTNDGTYATLMLLDPPMVSNAAAAVTIASGSKMVIGTTNGSESQMIVAPDNFEPVPNVRYLSKRISNIVMTDDWINDKKKVRFDENDLRQNALYNFQVGNEINDWLGVQSRFKVDVSNRHMNDEFVYTSEGILRQIKMFYSYEDNNLTTFDLNAIAKIDFTHYADNNYAKAYCGRDFIENLLNMDLTIHKEVKFENVDIAGMAIKAWKNNFGQIDFVYAPVLDLIGFEKFAAIVDIKNAIHYVKRSNRTDNVDMKKGTGEVREAKREIYSRIDCIALRGYNSILVGPSSQIANTSTLLPNITNFATAWDGETEVTWSNGDVAYLTADFGGYSAGDLIQYVAATTSWVEFAGEITV